jgi:uncharacterized protein (DUF1015 family)
MPVAVVRPFAALRPPAGLTERVAAPPYDVVDTVEASALAAGNHVSFLRVSRPEVDLDPGVAVDADEVYAKGRENLAEFVRRGVLVADPTPGFYVYRQDWRGYRQTGIVGCTGVADYRSGAIRIHEHTRPDKELDRIRHIDALGAHDEPVFYLAPRVDAVEAVIDAVTAGEPAVAFEAEGVTHTLWVVADAADVATIETAYAEVPYLYVADGHHRSAAAAKVHELRAGQPGEHDVFLTVVFARDQLRILPYNRVVTDLGGLTPDELLEALARDFEVAPSDAPVEPDRRQTFGMFLDGRWYTLTARNHEARDAVGALDVSLLQDRVLAPLLGIDDPRTDKRIGFVGGIRGPAELERLVRSGARAVAFSLHPTSVDDLIAIADAGQIMPPKSTWFEPKLRSGLFVHAI